MRRRVSEEELLQIPVDGQVEVRIEEEERACAADRIRELLVPLLPSLPAEDRRLLRLCDAGKRSGGGLSKAPGRAGSPAWGGFVYGTCTVRAMLMPTVCPGVRVFTTWTV
jgi:hypothetical protein